MSRVKTAQNEKKPADFNVKPFLHDGVKEEEVLAMKEAFDIFDSDRSGTIDIEELKRAIVSLGLEHSAEKILNLLSDLDEDKSGAIDFGEFLKLLGFYQKDMNDEEHLKHLYQEFAHSNGLISVEDFKRIAEQVGERYGDDELREMIEFADMDKDDFVNFDEFKEVVLKEYK